MPCKESIKEKPNAAQTIGSSGLVHLAIPGGIECEPLNCVCISDSCQCLGHIACEHMAQEYATVFWRMITKANNWYAG
eukprot:1155659-Pelagomonas_calceolata.AAC.2